MERSHLFDLMRKLQRKKAPFDEVPATAVKRQHDPLRIVGDLPNAENNERLARAINYQRTIARLPPAKDLGDFQFKGTAIIQMLSAAFPGGTSSTNSAATSCAPAAPRPPLTPRLSMSLEFQDFAADHGTAEAAEAEPSQRSSYRHVPDRPLW